MFNLNLFTFALTDRKGKLGPTVTDENSKLLFFNVDVYSFSFL